MSENKKENFLGKKHSRDTEGINQQTEEDAKITSQNPDLENHKKIKEPEINEQRKEGFNNISEIRVCKPNFESYDLNNKIKISFNETQILQNYFDKIYKIADPNKTEKDVNIFAKDQSNFTEENSNKDQIFESSLRPRPIEHHTNIFNVENFNQINIHMEDKTSTNLSEGDKEKKILRFFNPISNCIGGKRLFFNCWLGIRLQYYLYMH